MMLGIGKSIQNNAIMLSCEPHKEVYGPQMVDRDASVLQKFGAYLGTDPAEELDANTYAWELFTVADVGPITNPGGGSLNIVCNSNPQAGRWTLQNTADLNSNLTNGVDYRILVRVKANWEDDNMYVRLWTTFSTSLTEDLGGSLASSDGYAWTTAGDVDRWKWIGAKFTAAAAPYIAIQTVAPYDASHVFSIGKIYVGKKL